MKITGTVCVHDIGMVTSTGAAFCDPSTQGLVRLAAGSTEAMVSYLPNESLEAEVILAQGATATTCIGSGSEAEVGQTVILHNPMIAFWKRAVLYYETRQELIQRGYLLRFEDYALIISDLGQSLYMLFGRHWNEEAKAKYRAKVGTPPSETPDLLALLEKYYPPIGWDLPADDSKLWGLLHDFILNCYQDIVKHFEFSKFEKALSLTFEDLCGFMEVARRTWIWFIEQYFGIRYDAAHDAFRVFSKSYRSLA